MTLHSRKSPSQSGFTLAEVLIAIAITVIWGVAAFAANQNLMLSLRSHRETTAASLMLQERMEQFRSVGYSAIANPTASGSTDPSQWTAGDIVSNATASEAELGGITGSLQEVIKVSGYMDAISGANVDNSNPSKNVWTRNSANPTASCTPSPAVTTLATTYDLIKVDITISWTGANGRPRVRETAAVFGKGNLSQ